MTFSYLIRRLHDCLTAILSNDKLKDDRGVGGGETGGTGPVYTHVPLGTSPSTLLLDLALIDLLLDCYCT